ncbi:MAG: SGNH/GDSL hydrolase family protein [Clostridia bacterium]|nr:SGNH/GDSL hydrolase family protein [Clostridia bacterium]
MYLSIEEIKNITFGALSVKETENGISFYRCTEKQIEEWYKVVDHVGERSTMSTGVCFDFHTDSKNISFDAADGKFEVYVNGIFAERYDMSELHESGKDASFCVSGEKNRITVVFPCREIRGVIKYLKLDDGASIEPHKYDMKMLFIGDSITQGSASSLDSLSYAPRTARFFNAEMLNQGVGSAYCNEKTFDHLDFDPDVVILAYGANDPVFYDTVEEIDAHINAFYDLVAAEYKEKNTKIVAISPIPIISFKSDEVREKFFGCRRMIEYEAEKHGFYYVDGYGLVPNHKAFFSEDGVHPNDLGFGVYAENLIARLVRIL